MAATLLDTPCGLFPIREHIVKRHAAMSDIEIADATFKSQPGFINPEAFAELKHRGLIFRGDYEEDVYRRIAARDHDDQEQP